MLANDPAAADPVCIKSPQHHLVEQAVAQAGRNAPDGPGAGKSPREHPLVFREPAASRRLAEEAAMRAKALI